MTTGRRGLTLALCVLTAAGLAVDAYVHIDLAAAFDAVPGTISQGDLFRAQAAAAAVVALLVLVARVRLVYLLAFLLAASALGAVVLYTYVDVGPLGPLPAMYEPVWYTQKTLSAVAEGLAALAALALLILGRATGAPRHGDDVVANRPG